MFYCWLKKTQFGRWGYSEYLLEKSFVRYNYLSFVVPGDAVGTLLTIVRVARVSDWP